jgi:hypothetical protein
MPVGSSRGKRLALAGCAKAKFSAGKSRQPARRGITLDDALADGLAQGFIDGANVRLSFLAIFRFDRLPRFLDQRS